MDTAETEQSQQLQHQTEELITHSPMMGPEEEEHGVPYVFSPRDGRNPCHRRRRLLSNLRSVFCCGVPDVMANGQAHENGSSSPAVYPSGSSTDLIIGPKANSNDHKKTLVLDLDETLVHSSFSRFEEPDYVIPVDIDSRLVNVYVLKRPGLEEFLHRACELYEVVIFTASLSKYASPLLDLMDFEGKVEWRLFREACSIHRGAYVKDLRRLGRELSQTIIVDNSPLSYVFQPGNAVPIRAFMGDPSDQALSKLMPILEELTKVPDVRDGIRDIYAEGNETFSTEIASAEVMTTPQAYATA